MNFVFDNDDTFKAFVSLLKSDLTEAQIHYLIHELTKSSATKRQRTTVSFPDRIDRFCASKIYLKKNVFSNIIDLRRILSNFYSLRQLNPKSYGPQHHSHANVLHGFINMEPKAWESSAVLATFRNYLLYKLGELDENIIHCVLNYGNYKKIKSIHREVSAVVLFKQLIDEKLGLEYIISSKAFCLTWFRGADLNQIPVNGPMMIPDNFVNFEFLENLLKTADTSPRCFPFLQKKIPPRVFPLTLSSAENTFQKSINSSQKARKLSISDDAQLKKQVDLLVDEYANKEINNFFHFDSFQ